jgi:hypothetical protein
MRLNISSSTFLVASICRVLVRFLKKFFLLLLFILNKPLSYILLFASRITLIIVPQISEYAITPKCIITIVTIYSSGVAGTISP